MEVMGREDLTRAYASGFLYLGKVGLFGKWRAYKSESDFILMLGGAQHTLEDGRFMFNSLLKIEEAMFRLV